MRILLIEDDAVLRQVMCTSLTDCGHRVDEAANLADADTLWRVQPFDAVLLDLNLPDGSGLSALRAARRRGDHTPVLVLSARDRTSERIAGLDAGADDYLASRLTWARLMPGCVHWCAEPRARSTWCYWVRWHWTAAPAGLRCMGKRLNCRRANLKSCGN